MTLRHIGILGAGHAGGCAAAALRANGFDGRITLIGRERHPPYERPPLSKDLLRGGMLVEQTYLQPVEWYEQAGIELRLGAEALHIDRQNRSIELDRGPRVYYDSLLLTTGARARRLPAAVTQSDAICYVRDIEDAIALRSKLVPGVRLGIIGAGFIGLEIAATAAKSGCVVTVFESQNQPLARSTPSEIGTFMVQLHRKHGVRLEFGCNIESIEEAGSAWILHTSDGGLFEADIVVAGIGAIPNAEIAEAAGLNVNDGVVVDEFGRTDDPAVFAAGDVTRHFNPKLNRSIRLETWQNAQNHASAVAKVMAGGDTAFAETPWLWSDQYDVNLQIAGAPLRWDEVVVRGDINTHQFTLFQLLDQHLVGVVAVNNGREMRAARRLLDKGARVDPAALSDMNIGVQTLS